MVVPLVDEQERHVKSEERVRDLAEVFTPAATVQDMLNLLPREMWQVHPAPTFLEPSCGDGNFLVAILQRKLSAVSHAYATGGLAAGSDARAALFHGLQALASIYGVDISYENVVGGSPGHEIGARQRLIREMLRWHEGLLGEPLTEQSLALRAVEWIAENNVVIGNMLERQPDGEPSGRGEMTIKLYEWFPADLSVCIRETTLGAIMTEAQVESTGVMSLFGPPEPALLWQGKGFRLHEASGGLTGPIARRGKK